MIDLHCHVLPGVDDGSPDMATSIEFLRLAASTGTTDIIATSHQHAARYPNSGERLRQARETLLAERARLVAEGESLPEVHLGAEVHLDGDPVAELASGHRLSLAGGPSILLELPDVFSFPAVEDVVFRLKLAGSRWCSLIPSASGSSCGILRNCAGWSSRARSASSPRRQSRETSGRPAARSRSTGSRKACSTSSAPSRMTCAVGRRGSIPPRG